MSEKNIVSVLKLDKLVFDKIEFNRHGFKTDSKIEYQISGGISCDQENDIYKVTLILKGDKKDEYSFEVVLSGYFRIDFSTEIDESKKKDLIQRNTIAILMPYLRSEVSLLTAQPEVDCIVLPPFNINKMFE